MHEGCHEFTRLLMNVTKKPLTDIDVKDFFIYDLKSQISNY